MILRPGRAELERWQQAGPRLRPGLDRHQILCFGLPECRVTVECPLVDLTETFLRGGSADGCENEQGNAESGKCFSFVHDGL